MVSSWGSWGLASVASVAETASTTVASAAETVAPSVYTMMDKLEVIGNQVEKSVYDAIATGEGEEENGKSTSGDTATTNTKSNGKDNGDSQEGSQDKNDNKNNNDENDDDSDDDDGELEREENGGGNEEENEVTDIVAEGAATELVDSAKSRNDGKASTTDNYTISKEESNSDDAPAGEAGARC